MKDSTQNRTFYWYNSTETFRSLRRTKSWVRVRLIDLMNVELELAYLQHSRRDRTFIYLDDEDGVVKFWNAFKAKYGHEPDIRLDTEDNSSDGYIRNLPLVS